LSASAGSNNPFTDVIISSTEPYKNEKKNCINEGKYSFANNQCGATWGNKHRKS
jgi:hypothetical protein